MPVPAVAPAARPRPTHVPTRPAAVPPTPHPPCEQVHALNERILDFGLGLRASLGEEADGVERTSVADITQVGVLGV